MSHVFPRRRDVRDRCEELLSVLQANRFCAEFDRDFLTGVRNLMRSGVPFEDAVGSYAMLPAEDADAELSAASQAFADIAAAEPVASLRKLLQDKLAT
jgi:hypothetical protein